MVNYFQKRPFPTDKFWETPVATEIPVVGNFTARESEQVKVLRMSAFPDNNF